MVDVDDSDQKEYINKLINTFFGHVIYHLYLFFKGNLNENSFWYLQDLLVTMVDINNEVYIEYVKKLINILFYPMDPGCSSNSGTNTTVNQQGIISRNK